MSSEITLFSEGSNNIPAHLLTGGSSEMTQALAGSTSTRWISIKGSVFRMMLGSQEVTKNEDRAMRFVIVGAANGFARTYYDAPYEDGKLSAPACWSDNGKTPSENCETPQSADCNTCPQNIQGSARGGKGRACTFKARLAVALDGDLDGGVYGVTIPAQSIFGEGNGTHSPLQEYARKLAGFNISMEKVVTEFKFDTASPVPKLFFRAVRPLNEEEFATVQELAKRPDVKFHVGPRKFEKKDESGDNGFSEPPAPKAEEPKVAKSKKAKVEEPSPDVSAILEEWADD